MYDEPLLQKPTEMQEFLSQEHKQFPVFRTGNGGNQSHYYGDLVRRLFLFAAILMGVGLPFALDLLHMPLWMSLFAIALLALFAGLTTPSKAWVITVDTVLTVAGFIYFQYSAVDAFMIHRYGVMMLDQFLAIVFLVAMYYSTKSFRGATFDHG